MTWTEQPNLLVWERFVTQLFISQLFDLRLLCHAGLCLQFLYIPSVNIFLCFSFLLSSLVLRKTKESALTKILCK